MDARQRAIAELRREGLSVTEWRDEPGTAYPEHAHAQREVRIVLDGAMTMRVDGRDVELGPGDRIDLEPDALHSATVSADGVHYLAGSDR